VHPHGRLAAEWTDRGRGGRPRKDDDTVGFRQDLLDQQTCRDQGQKTAKQLNTGSRGNSRRSYGVLRHLILVRVHQKPRRAKLARRNTMGDFVGKQTSNRERAEPSLFPEELGEASAPPAHKVHAFELFTEPGLRAEALRLLRSTQCRTAAE